MSFSLNKVEIIGYLGADPEVRSSQSGDTIVTLSVATNETWRDKESGQRRGKTEWHRVVIFNQGLAKIAQQYLTKGALVFLEGRLQTQTWKDQTGKDRFTTEIVLTAYQAKLGLLGSKNGSTRSDADHDEAIAPAAADQDDGEPIPF
jgi:single-strand DNA-binding protein